MYEEVGFVYYKLRGATGGCGAYKITLRSKVEIRSYHIYSIVGKMKGVILSYNICVTQECVMFCRTINLTYMKLLDFKFYFIILSYILIILIILSLFKNFHLIVLSVTSYIFLG